MTDSSQYDRLCVSLRIFIPCLPPVLPLTHSATIHARRRYTVVSELTSNLALIYQNRTSSDPTQPLARFATATHVRGVKSVACVTSEVRAWRCDAMESAPLKCHCSTSPSFISQDMQFTLNLPSIFRSTSKRNHIFLPSPNQEPDIFHGNSYF